MLLKLVNCRLSVGYRRMQSTISSMDDIQAQRRLDVLANQLAGQISADLLAEQAQQLRLSPTTGQTTEARTLQLMEEGPEYAVPLPEKLQPDGPWQVYRCGTVYGCYMRHGTAGHTPAACL
eukprot:GHUV01048142.1.p1 GENE.GHUV01048142.1~~GHUV01048142.1.p1  ORF type:complete len:121 (-),score=24.21 GHUV01048142.1:310-672(-)